MVLGMFRDNDSDLDAFLGNVHDPPNFQGKPVWCASWQVLGQDSLPWLFSGFCLME